MIAEVYLWIVDATVTVLDEYGNQIPDYQGHHRQVVGRIVRDAPPAAVFYQANLSVGLKQKITREKFAKV
jgi:hypothetical protein